MNKLITTLIFACTFNAVADTTTQSPDGKTVAVIHRAGMITSLDNDGNRQVAASVTISQSVGKNTKGRFMITSATR